MATKKKQVVYVMLYGHKHGTDYSVFSTAEKAWACVKDIILQYVNELDDADEKKMRRLLKLKSLGKAMTMWAEKKEEWFEVDARTVNS